MFVRNLGLSCFFSLKKLQIFLKQTFLKDSKKIKLNHQKVNHQILFKKIIKYFSKVVQVPTVLFSSKYWYRDTFKKYRAHLRHFETQHPNLAELDANEETVSTKFRYQSSLPTKLF